MSDKSSATGVGKSMIFAMWILLIAGLTFFFNQWMEERQNPNRNIAVSINGSGNPEVILQRNYGGHFVANGTINGKPVAFLVDTGATDVNIPQRVAKRLNLEAGQTRLATTANGTITVFATNLDSIGIGGLQLRNIRASINPHMYTEEILLGMSFLRHLELNQKGDNLRLSLPQ